MATTTDASVRQRTRSSAARGPLVAAAIVCAQVLFVFCFSYPALHAKPHHVPVGVAGPSAAVTAIGGTLSGGGAIEVHRYPSVAAARAAVRHRAVYGAIVLDGAGPRMLVASAASPEVASMLRQRAVALGGQVGGGRTAGRVPVTDVVPAAARDRQGAGMLTTLLPLVSTSVALGLLLTTVAAGRTRRVSLVIGASIAAGLGVAGVAGGLGVFPAHYWPVAGLLGLLVIALAASSAGLCRMLGRPGFALLAGLMLFLGIPASGAQLPAELLVQPWRSVGELLPPGAAVDALRGAVFFHGVGTAAPVFVLACWAAVGLLLLAVPARPAGRVRA